MLLRELDDGLHPGIPNEVYFQRDLDIASKSAIDVIVERSLRHYHYYQTHPEEDNDTPAMLLGRAYHALILEPGDFDNRFVLSPKFDLRTNAGKAALAEFELENKGKARLLQHDWDRLQAMADVMRAHPLASSILRGAETEITMLWKDRQTGVRCKSKMDILRRDLGIVADLKTTDDCGSRNFARSAAKYGYHVQHAQYGDGAAACGIDLKHYLMIAQEKEPPYCVGVHQINAVAETRGFEIRHEALTSLATALETNRWPGPVADDRINELSLPTWALIGD